MRPTFQLYDKPVCSSGILFYCENKVLVLDDGKCFQEPGGKTEHLDTCIFDTAIRETKEEIGTFKYNIFKCDSADDIKHIYISQSKYVLYIIKVPKMRYNGVKVVDTHNHKQRTIKWIDLKTINRNKLHIRLRFAQRAIISKLYKTDV